MPLLPQHSVTMRRRPAFIVACALVVAAGVHATQGAAATVPQTHGGPRLALTSFTASTGGPLARYLISVRNQSDISLRPVFALVVRDARGRTIQRTQTHLDALLPHATIDHPVLMRRQLASGMYDAVVRLSYGHGRHAQFERRFLIAGPVTVPAQQQSTPDRMALISWVGHDVGLLIALIGILVLCQTRWPAPSVRGARSDRADRNNLGGLRV